ncbi:FAD:protein FMN transferase [soil metagenome]
MRSAERASGALACLLLAGQALLPAQALSPVQQQRYCMGTMFSVVVYHPDVHEATVAIGQALDEIVRLDGVMSHYKTDSDLSRLSHDARTGFVATEPSLYEVLELSVDFARRSGGKFDVTIAPLLRTWRDAHEAGRPPSAEDLASVARCVGYEHIEMSPPNRVRFHSDCLELDLGGIGKGYAVDRALAVLRSAGIQHALVNAGGSTIGAIGRPPGVTGWPVQLAASLSGRETLMLSNASISTSQQHLTRRSLGGSRFGEIVDPRERAPIQHTGTVSVVAASATTSDALSTTLLVMPVGEGTQLLDRFGDVSALWISPAGELQAAYRASGLQLAASR